MSLIATAKYHANVSVLGRSFLRIERLRAERKLNNPAYWKNPHINQPLSVSPWLKELISLHYLKGRYASGHQPVAWVTSGAPTEFLQALGYFLIYPENHAAVCGIRRTAEAMCIVAEDGGYSRDLCSYVRTDFGVLMSGKTPVGRLPKPDLLVCCNNICQTVLFWYRVLADHFRVPLIIVDTPFMYEDEVGEHAVDYVKQQIEAAVEVAERVAGRSMDFAHFQEVTRVAKEGCTLWLEVMRTGANRPAPITAFDEFIHLAPIVEMRGDTISVDYYRAMLDELQKRVQQGFGAIKNEKKRLVWDNLPIWFKINKFSNHLASRGVALVASTYTNAWGEVAPMLDPTRPIESMARVYMHPILNRSTGHKLKTMRAMIEEYHADGVILHSDRSCKPYSIGQIDQSKRIARELGIPSLVLEADHNDPRLFTDEQADARIEPFLEMLGV